MACPPTPKDPAYWKHANGADVTWETRAEWDAERLNIENPRCEARNDDGCRCIQRVNDHPSEHEYDLYGRCPGGEHTYDGPEQRAWHALNNR